MANHFEIAKNEAEEYISLLNKKQLESLCKKYGKSDKEIKQWLK
jgi:abortive infection bacteriophage resistance protein